MEVYTPKREGEYIMGDTAKDGVFDKGEPWEYEFVDQRTETKTANVYVVVMGQAVVTRSDTTSLALGAKTGKGMGQGNTGMRNT